MKNRFLALKSPQTRMKPKKNGPVIYYDRPICWEGVDFPGDMVSSLILVRLPFPVPDPLSEAEREQYPTL